MHARIHEINHFRNACYVFKDRLEAGEILSRMLDPEYRGAHNLIVLAIPSGGVPVGLKISEGLRAPFDLIIVRKIQVPDNPEAGFGAITLGGSIFLNRELLSHLRLSPSQITKQMDIVKEALERRNKLFRGGRAFPDISKKMVILVDDGIASGYTMMASIHNVREMGAQRIVVAVPTAPASSIKRIEKLVEEIYCANIRETPYFAVAEAYKHWYDLSSKEVVELISKRDKKMHEGG